MEFKVVKKSKKSRARIGVLKTIHGEIETPAFVGVATQAVVKTLTSEEARATGLQLLIANTFYLHLRPGEKTVGDLGGLAKFMNWERPLMTDSGGFQVFSLGFGKDTGVGKILKYFPGETDSEKLKTNSQPKEIKIGYDGVEFRSPLNGQKLFIGPKESIQIQEALGADIIFAFDECTSPLAGYEYVCRSLERTHRWAKICLAVKKSQQALFGIVQGSSFQDLREQSAEFINNLDFDGFGIGGDLGKGKDEMMKILGWTIPKLNENKPRHLLGIGYLEDMENIIKAGVDLFDCTAPTHYARHGTAFTVKGRLDLRKSIYWQDKGAVEKECGCLTCQNYSRAYIHHLLRAREITGQKLLTIHNLYYYNEYVAEIRERIKKEKI